ncbi:tetratricopeptide repeat protein [Photobacterium proteolyticum]|uniref:tetratricopeptide repeat protein n=1 Tax=Photobacterium proteolyticum TaxID=1903952 RepID=UPI000A6BEDE9|nr:hypothetical protein [Photobacterium proteolyticum]
MNKLSFSFRSIAKPAVSAVLSLSLLAPLQVNAQSSEVANAQAESDTGLVVTRGFNVTEDTQSAQLQKWVYTAQDQRQSDEERAEALRQLARYPNQNSLVAVVRGLRDSSAAVREAAVIGAEPYQFEHRWRMISPLLNDPVFQVKLAATTSLIRDFGNMSPEQQAMMENPTSALIQHLSEQEDKGMQLLLADVYRWHQEFGRASRIYQRLLADNQTDPQIWLSMADNQRALGLDSDALVTLEQAIERLPNEANLHYSKALTLVRLEQKNVAAKAMQRAASLAKTNSYFWYLSGVLQEPVNLDAAISAFEQAYLISGAPEQLYAVCDIYIRNGHQKTDACLQELGKIAPEYVINELQSKRG